MGVIYKIVNVKNNACYIGSSIGDGRLRWNRHKTNLNKNNHHSQYLQRAWNKYGKNNFKFEIIEDILNIDGKELLVIEQKYLDDRKLNYPSELNYNVCWIAGNRLGYTYSEKSREKMSKSHLGKTVSQKVRDKISNTWEEKSDITYKLIAPDDTIHEFKNIRKFCRDNNLQSVTIGLLLKGKIHYCNGWIKDTTYLYNFIDPNGNVYENIRKLTTFCDEHKINMKCMSKLHRGHLKTYLGWKKFNKI